MKRTSKSRSSKKCDNSDNEYAFSVEYRAEDSHLIEVNSPLSLFVTLFCILFVALFTIFLVAVKHSDGKITSPREAISSFFMPLQSNYYEIRVDPASGYASNNEACTKFMEDNGYSNRLETSVFNRNTIMQLDQEDGKSYTLPGAYGSTTFYIKPRSADTDLTIHIEYDVYGIKQLDDGNLARISEINSSGYECDLFRNVDDLLDGHILFFENRTDGKYSGLIKNGKMTYRTSEHEDDLNDNGEYKIKVYWVWAEYYEQIVNAQADGALFDNSNQQNKMIEYIEDNPDEFFCTAEIGAIPNGTTMTDYDLLSDYYDNGDKLIVENTDYFGFNVNTCAEN